MVNVRTIANALTRSINPNIGATVRRYTGETTAASGKRAANYAAPTPLVVQAQALSKKEVDHLNSMGISNATRAAYANGQLAAMDRKTQSGGDLLQFENIVWLVGAVLEGWTTAGWCKVALIQQLGEPIV